LFIQPDYKIDDELIAPYLDEYIPSNKDDGFKVNFIDVDINK
jgi:hypothetical protein